MNFKIIKQKAFTFSDAKGTEQKGVAYTVAHKGRAFQVSTLNFEEGQLSEAKGVLTIQGDLDAVKAPYTDSLGNSAVGVKLMPKMDLVLSDF